MPKGIQNGRAKLTEADVKHCRELWKLFGGRRDPRPGKHNNRIISAKKLAREHRVSTSTMDALLRGQSWTHL